mgnify:FL=1
MSNLTAAEQQALNDMETTLSAKENDGDSQAVEREITLLESWLSVLSNAEGARDERITPSETIAALGRHANLLTLKDIPGYFDRYYELLIGAYDIVRAQVEDNVEALNVSKEDDAELNWKHYANIYMLWRQHLMTAEREWDINSEGAAAELAALQDAAGFLFGPTGLVQHLDVIGFSLTPEDMELMDDAAEAKDDSE